MNLDAATIICGACVAGLGVLWWVAPMLDMSDDPIGPAPDVDVIAEAKRRRTPDPGPLHFYWLQPNLPAPWHTGEVPVPFWLEGLGQAEIPQLVESPLLTPLAARVIDPDAWAAVRALTARFAAGQLVAVLAITARFAPGPPPAVAA